MSDVMPAAFIGHGSPMNTLEHNQYTQVWRALGAALPRPRAILSISAHWYINATALTAMAQPRVIHDFYGFPPELFAFDYPAPGDPDLATEIVGLVEPVWVGLDHDSWGIDHGTWSVLAHLWPDADVPVIQLSINAMKPFEYHLDLGRRLAPLRDRGVLILGSGNVVHNLGRLDPTSETSGFDWAERFDEHAKAAMLDDPSSLARAESHDDFRLAAPTPDHFIPLLTIAGVAAESTGGADVLLEGYALGSLSMTSYTVGLDAPPAVDDDADTAVGTGDLEPGGIPADATNL